MLKLPQNFTVSLSYILSKSDLWPFTMVTIGFSSDHKVHCDLPVKVETYGSSVINVVFAEV